MDGTTAAQPAAAPAAAWASEASLCAICLEPFAEPSLRGSSECNHYFHEACISTWLLEEKSCPICRRVPDAIDITNDDAVTPAPPAPVPQSRLSWLWSFLMILPWPRSSAATDEPWDASRGIGDWRARMQAIYDAEAAAEAATEEEESDDDDDEEEEDNYAAVEAALARLSALHMERSAATEAAEAAAASPPGADELCTDRAS